MLKFIVVYIFIKFPIVFLEVTQNGRQGVKAAHLERGGGEWRS